MKRSVILSTSIFALLAACGGGNSSGSGDSVDLKPKPKPIAKTESSLAKYKISTITGSNGLPVINDISALNGAVTFDEDRNLLVNGKIPPKFVYGQVGPTADEIPTGAGYFLYVDDEGKNHAHAGYFSTEDYANELKKLGNKEFTLITAPSSQVELGWKDVPFGYFIADGTDISDHLEGSDGTISVNGSSWKADFGKVKLDGTIDGYDVAGRATLDDMSGEFEGVDGLWTLSNPTVSFDGAYTTGAFAGDNGTDRSFAGGWFGDDDDSEDE